MILLLAGTADGREIFSLLKEKGYPVVATVTTAYGAQALAGGRTAGARAPAGGANGADGADGAGGAVFSRALGAAGMAVFIREKKINAVVDASHPFAVRASANARRACKAAGVPYVRYERPMANLPEDPLIHAVRDFSRAARKAVSFGEPIFLTTGSKTLPVFVAEAKRAGKRVVARVLPAPEVLARCLALGLQPADLIALQGPFSYEFNRALLREYRAAVLVTKESGPAGGTEEKVKAALDLGIPVVLIKRPAARYPRVVSNYAELLGILENLPKGERWE